MRTANSCANYAGLYRQICECNHLSRSSNERERSKHLKSEFNKRIYETYTDNICAYMDLPSPAPDIPPIYVPIPTYPSMLSIQCCYLYDVNT